jgi:methylphosphotriester-DNA--protein-cysteine methyltransferase
VTLPTINSERYFLLGSQWQFPSWENADTFVNRLVRGEMIVGDAEVEDALRGRTGGVSSRSVQRAFLRTTGITQATVRQIERARFAARLLQGGASIADAVYESGYSDQPHLTRSLRRFIGKTPVQLSCPDGSSQLSLLYETRPFPAALRQPACVH